MAHTIKNAKFVQSKSRTHQVRQVAPSAYEVTSGASGTRYEVTLTPAGGATCTCTWGHYRPKSGGFRSGCSHAIAVFDYIAEQRRVSAWTNEEDAKRQHRPTLNIGDGVILTSRKVGA